MFRYFAQRASRGICPSSVSAARSLWQSLQRVRSASSSLWRKCAALVRCLAVNMKRTCFISVAMHQVRGCGRGGSSQGPVITKVLTARRSLLPHFDVNMTRARFIAPTMCQGRGRRGGWRGCQGPMRRIFGRLPHINVNMAQARFITRTLRRRRGGGRG